MKILFKQFFRTFKKNFFLILGLTSLMMVLSFLISTCINVTISFASALDELNAKGNKSNVVSSVPNDFGYLDFSYSQSLNKEPYYVYSSTIELQYDKNTGEFTREANTFFPYNKDELLSRPSNFGISSGLTFYPNRTNINQMFAFDENDRFGSWHYNFGLTEAPPISFVINKEQAIAYSFVDSNKQVLFNPQSILFNKDGIPISFFIRGQLSNSSKLTCTFNMYDKKAFSKYPNIYDANGLGVSFFNRSNKKVHVLHNAEIINNLEPQNYKIWPKTDNFIFEVYSHFIQKTNVIPYVFNIDFNNSVGPIKHFLQTHPEIFEKIFNKIFYGNQVTRKNVPGGKDELIHNNIELVKNPNSDFSYSIILGVNEDMFVDYSSIKLDPNLNPSDPNSLQKQFEEQKQKQIQLNKELYLNNFKGYLSTNFLKEAKDYFVMDSIQQLRKEGIDINVQSQYYYLDPQTRDEILFVGKANDGNDDVIVNQGNNIINSDKIQNIKYDLNKKVNNLVSTNTFYALKELMDLIPESSMPQRPSKQTPHAIGQNPDDVTATLGWWSSDYYWFALLNYCLNKIIVDLDSLGGRNQVLPDQIINKSYFIVFLKLLMDMTVKFNGNLIEPNFNIKKSYTTLFFDNKFYISIWDNYFCVVNNAYADVNKKKYLPFGINQKKVDQWLNKFIELEKIGKKSLRVQAFNSWLESISNTDSLILSSDEIKLIFNSNQFYFNYWLSYLPSSYKIKFQNNTFLINGFGISPEFAYPSISPSAPIPNPETQAIVFLNSFTYDSLDVSDINKFQYFTYSSKKYNSKEIIDKVQNYTNSVIGYNFFHPEYINEAKNLPQVWIRVYFPNEIKNLIIIFSVIGSVVLILLSTIVVYLLLKSFIKNMLEPISLCMGNGVPLYKIILSCMMNLGIITTLATMISYIISYFVQNQIIGLFSTIWLVPNTVALPFSPAIFLPLIVITFLVFGGLLSWIVYSKFKKPIPEIIANKQDIKTNWLTNILRNNKLRLPGLVKLTIGFSSINIGRIILLSLLGSAALGGIVSSIMINDKFQDSRAYTNNTQQFNYQYDYINVNESTGLYKPQKFSEIGMEDKSVGINSIYLDKAEFDKVPSNEKLPYYKEELVINKIPKGGNETDVTPKEPKKYLSNMIMPSWNTYNFIVKRDINSLFNGAASIFLLDLPVKFLTVSINIWDFVKGNFPTWVVTQLESQAQLFQNCIMKYYGEWFFKFINIVKEVNLIQEEPFTNNGRLDLSNVDLNDSGYYYAEVIKGTHKYYTKPYYLWVDSEEWYADKNENITNRYEVKSGASVTMNYDPNNDFYTKNLDGTYQKYPISNLKNAKIKWNYVPAYDYYHSLTDAKVANYTNDLYAIKYSNEFIKFITTIYGDERVSSQDSKISFGILPFDKTINETFTNVEATITRLTNPFGKSYAPSEPNINIFGIKPNSDYIVLEDKKGNNISNISPSSNNVINIVVNNGAALKFNLKVGDEFSADINNNSLVSSFKFINDMMNFSMVNPINRSYTFKVVGINNDSFGCKFYINQQDANRITGLDQMRFYTKLLPNVESVDPKTINKDFVPFNGILSKNKELLVSNKSLPFYTFGNIWTIDTRTSNIQRINQINNVFDSLLTHDKNILLEIAKYIKTKIDKNFVYDENDMLLTRKNILNFIQENYTDSSILRALNTMNQNDILQSSIKICVPTSTTNEMFDKISNLTVTLLIIVSSIIIPLLFIVVLITSLSIINDLIKNIGLMKILGFSNRNVVLMFLMIYSSILIISIILGLGIMFACTYGLQSLVFNLTSIFISGSVQVSSFFIGVAASVAILLITVLFIAIVLNKKGIENSIKF